jgi:hypothetical protein
MPKVRRIKKGEPGYAAGKKFVVEGTHNGKPYVVRFGDRNMEIKRDDPKRRKAFRDRHNCSDPGPPNKARWWSCKLWSKKKVSDIAK